ncbi:MAG: hypothetical protein WBN41_15580 [Lysobacterales bacterium]
MSKLVSSLLIVVGVINFLPVFAVLSATNLEQAYSVEFANNDLIILMRHRALLFGIIGGFILFSVFAPSFQTPAMIMAALSMIGFLYLVWTVGGHNDAISRIAVIDVAGIACLALAAVLKLLAGGK